MRSIRAFLMSVAVIAAGVISPAQAAWTWETLDYPGADWSFAAGVDGDTIVGAYGFGAYGGSAGDMHGFIRTGDTWEALNYPGSAWTLPLDVSGNTVVGTYRDAADNMHGFLYDGTWQTIDYPGAITTTPRGISGDRIVGSYQTGPVTGDGFILDGEDWTTLRYTSSVRPSGIDGSTIVGEDNQTGFIYDGTTWQYLTCPLGVSGLMFSTAFEDVSGGNIIGNATWSYYPYFDMIDFSFLYDGTDWTVLSHPLAGSSGTYGGTSAYGISGNTIVGSYRDASDTLHGFVLTIPEPASLTLLALGGVAMMLRRGKRPAGRG